MKVTPIDHHHIFVLKRFTSTMTTQRMAIEFVTIFRFNHVMLFSEHIYVLFFMFLTVKTKPVPPIIYK